MQVELGEFVARPLQEQHRHVHVGQMVAALARRACPAGGAESRGRRGRRRPAAAPAPGPARSCGRRRTCRRRSAAGPAPGAPLRRPRHARRHGPPPAYPAAGCRPPCTGTGSGASRCRARQHRRHGGKERVGHAGTGAVGQHVERRAPPGQRQQPGDAALRPDGEGERLGRLTHAGHRPPPPPYPGRPPPRREWHRSRTASG